MKGFNSLFLGKTDLLLVGKVSGNVQITNIKFDIAKHVATHTGRVTLYFAKVVPSPGPKIKPNPKATPINPNVLARFSGVDISANTAVAVAAVPPLTPSIILAINSSKRGRLPAQTGRKLFQLILTVKANIDSPITDPDTQVMIIGFLPKRSLNAPIKGATVNCAIAYVPASKPSVLPLLVNRSKRNGSNGKTIVSPSRSFSSVIKALNRVGILGFCTF